jgi:hypothetical protein
VKTILRYAFLFASTYWSKKISPHARFAERRENVENESAPRRRICNFTLNRAPISVEFTGMEKVNRIAMQEQVRSVAPFPHKISMTARQSRYIRA